MTHLPEQPAASSGPPDSQGEPSFEQSAQEKPLSLAKEFWLFLIENKAWWLAPIVIVLLLLTLLIALASTGAAPFIYTVF